MDVAVDALLSHTVIEPIAEIRILTEKADKVKMTAGTMFFAVVIQYLDIQPLERLIVTVDQLMAACQHFVISSQLRQTDRREYVGHITFVLGVDNVVFPRGALILG